jgi:folate-binding Fe-S cluster repair protein YgfZ
MSIERARDHDEPFRWSRIVVQGPASETFLQGQLSQDLSGVDERGTWSSLLDPNSDVLATCYVSAIDVGFAVLVARSLGEIALARLRRFHLRVDCSLALEDVAHGPYNTVGEQIDQREPGPAEFLGLSPQCYGDAFVERTVSFTKGCFTGQELVARLDARGSNVPWRFVYAQGPTLEDIDAFLRARGPRDPSGPSGVTSAVRRDGGIDALGFIHRSALADLDVRVAHDEPVKVTVIA